MQKLYRLYFFILLVVSISSCSAEGNNKLSCRMKVIIKNDTILIRGHLNENEDIIQEYIKTRNDNYTPNSTYIGPNTYQDKVIMQNKIHYTYDSTAPITNSNVSWHLYMQHGYLIPKLIAKDHRLSKEDIGSLWKDEKDREYILGKITGEYLYMLPKIRMTATEGIYTRDWETSKSGYPSVLHHLYGGRNTNDVIIKRGSSFQIKPIQKAIERAFFVDGKRVTECGIYECYEFQITETLSCLNPFSLEIWFPKPVMKDELLRITQTFIFCGLSTSYNTVLDVKSSIMFGGYGCNQAKHLMKYRDYDAYVMLPRVKKFANKHRVDVPFIQNTVKGKSIKVLRTKDDVYDINKLPDREISFLYNPLLGYKLGFASGLSLTKGLTVDSTRINYIPVGSVSLKMSPANRNKMYIKALNKKVFENGVLPRGFKAEFHSYFSYFDPSQNVGQVYWYKDGDEFFIYAHCQSKHDSIIIKTPEIMNDYVLSVVDRTDGAELKSKKVENNGSINISYMNNEANYIVIKASKR